jgi:putative spermidine/putrescine transport system ATP-binding protein
MALADLVVVMKSGRIEQAGSPRQVFNAPLTEFVAQFIGGHNVIRSPQGAIAVRADRLVVTGKRVNAGLAATVRSVEYQGTHVNLALDASEAQDLTALVTDAAYEAEPLKPGDSVMVTWAPEDTHPISA